MTLIDILAIFLAGFAIGATVSNLIWLIGRR